MPVIVEGSHVLVTGASGYIAAHVVKELLKKGYRVRGTVRSKSKGEYLKDLFKGDVDRFEYIVVEDMAKDGAFDEAVKGVSAVVHTASLFHFRANDPKELVEPAVRGTVGVLKSIQKNNPDVKRVVVTSSVAAILNLETTKPPYNYTEADWNKDSVPHIEQYGVDAKPVHKYLASKTLAEQALWKFINDENPSWDAATVNPPAVLGEVIHEIDPKQPNAATSVEGFLPWVTGKRAEEDLPAFQSAYVNVHQVAQAHVLALEVPEAGGERFITCAGNHSGQAIVDVLHDKYPQIKGVPVGKPGSHADAAKGQNTVDGSKAERVLGLKYDTWENLVVQMTDSLAKKNIITL